MEREYIISACTGAAIEVKEGQFIKIIDIEGKQVVDFFAEVLNEPSEFLSTGVTIDCNESLRLNINNIIYTNKYQRMFKVIEDTVGEHDLLHPCCRKEMYDFFYHNCANHLNCFDNINRNLNERREIITPLNLFMYTKVNTDGTISVETPPSKAGDYITLEALMNVRLGVAACSVSESKCNGGCCTGIKIVIFD